MSQSLSPEIMKQLFTEARTHHHWQAKPVSDDTLHAIYDLAKWAPTSMNSGPMRITFIKSAAEKEKLLPALMGSNIEQVKAAPVTAIISIDTEFFNHMPRLFPAFDAKTMLQSNQAMAEITAMRNSSMQGGYFIMACRALGLDVGPMSGFDNAKVDEIFYKGTTWKSNFLCNIGYGVAEKLYPRGARLDFAEACKII